MSVDARLVAPAAACWLTAGMLVMQPHAAAVWAIALWLAALSATVTAIGIARAASRGAGRGAGRGGGRGPSRGITGQITGRIIGRIIGAVVGCLVASAVAASAVAYAAPARAPSELTAGSGTHVVRAVARVDSAPQAVIEPTGGAGGVGGVVGARLRFTATLRTVHTSTGVVTGAMPTLVTLTATTDQARSIAIGTELVLTGTLHAADPGQRSAFFLGVSAPATVAAPAAGVLAWTNDLRSGFAAAAAGLPGDGGALLPGLSIGDVSAVNASLDAAMKLSSLSHLTAVSGRKYDACLDLRFTVGRA